MYLSKYTSERTQINVIISVIPQKRIGRLAVKHLDSQRLRLHAHNVILSEVPDLDRGFVKLTEQNVIWLQILLDNTICTSKVESRTDLLFENVRSSTISELRVLVCNVTL